MGASNRRENMEMERQKVSPGGEGVVVWLTGWGQIIQGVLY